MRGVAPHEEAGAHVAGVDGEAGSPESRMEALAAEVAELRGLLSHQHQGCLGIEPPPEPVAAPSEGPAVDAGVAGVSTSEGLPGTGPRVVLGGRRLGLGPGAATVLGSGRTDGTAVHTVEVTVTNPLVLLGGVPESLGVCEALLGSKGQADLQDLQGEHILFFEVESRGRRMDMPSDTGCTLSMVSGKHYEYLRDAETNDGVHPLHGALDYQELRRPVRVTNAAEGKCLYATGVAQVPILLEGKDGRLVENYFQSLVVPGLAWDMLLGQNHLALGDAVTYHQDREVHFRGEGFFDLVVAAPRRAPAPHKALADKAVPGPVVAGVSAFESPRGSEGVSVSLACFNRGPNGLEVLLISSDRGVDGVLPTEDSFTEPSVRVGSPLAGSGQSAFDGRTAIPGLLKALRLSGLDPLRAVGPYPTEGGSSRLFGIELTEREATMTPLGQAGREAYYYWQEVRRCPRWTPLGRDLVGVLIAMGVYRHKAGDPDPAGASLVVGAQAAAGIGPSLAEVEEGLGAYLARGGACDAIPGGVSMHQVEGEALTGGEPGTQVEEPPVWRKCIECQKFKHPRWLEVCTSCGDEYCAYCAQRHVRRCKKILENGRTGVTAGEEAQAGLSVESGQGMRSPHAHPKKRSGAGKSKGEPPKDFGAKGVPLGVSKGRTRLRPGFNVVTVLMVLGHVEALNTSYAAGHFGSADAAPLERIKAAGPGILNLWAEAAPGVRGEAGDRGRGKLKVLPGPVDWASLAVRTVAGPEPPTEPEGEPDLREEVYLNVPVYNQGSRTVVVPKGIPLLSLRQRTATDTAELKAGVSDAAEALVCDMVRGLEQQGKRRAARAAKGSRNRRGGSSGSQGTRRRRVQDFWANAATKTMEDAFEQVREDVARLDAKSLPYELRSAGAHAHDSTTVLDDDLDLAPIDTKRTLDPHSPEYADLVLKELRFDDPDQVQARGLSREDEGALRALVVEKAHVFLIPGAPLRPLTGEAEGVEFEIFTGDAAAVYRPPFIRSPDQLKTLQEEIAKMIELDVMEPAKRCRGWGAPAFLVKKKAEHGKPVAPRVVYDYRGLNAVTEPDRYALPNITTCLDQLTGSRHFSKMDLFSGFWHTPIKESDRHKTTVCTHIGLFQMKRMAFGLRNAPAYFQRLVNTALWTCSTRARLLTPVGSSRILCGRVCVFTLTTCWLMTRPSRSIWPISGRCSSAWSRRVLAPNRASALWRCLSNRSWASSLMLRRGSRTRRRSRLSGTSPTRLPGPPCSVSLGWLGTTGTSWRGSLSGRHTSGR